MREKTVHIFGNPDIPIDSLPLRILPALQRSFPDIRFVVLDPNEEWVVPNPFWAIDTVVGLTDLHVFHSLDEFGTSPTVSVHDFDALFNLRHLAKLGKLKRITVIGVPHDIKEDAALKGVALAIEDLVRGASESR